MSVIYIKNLNECIKDNTKIGCNFDKKDILTSSISIEDVITYTFKLPLSTPKEALKSEAEIQFFENAGLDLSKKYKTDYLIKEIKEEETYLIEAIAIEENKLKEKFNPIIEKTKHLDFISLDVLSFKEFYPLYEKEAKRDAFVYLDNEKSFISIYKDGEYLYSKTLPNLNNLLKKIGLDYDKFLELISTKGVNKEKYETEEFLIANEIDSFFSEYFMSINNRISYGKNIFYLDNIDNIYFYTPFKIEGIDSLKNFWELTGINFERVPLKDINLLDEVIYNYNKNNYEDGINFSIFPPPPKFYQLKTFQLAMVVLVTLLIFGGNGGYIYYQNMQIKSKIDSLNKQIKIKQSKLNRLKTINSVIINKKTKIEKEINEIETNMQTLKKQLTKALQIVNLPKRNKDLILISKLLQKHHLKSYKIFINKTSFEVSIYTTTKNRGNISDFMNALISKGYKNVFTNAIQSINNSYYLSKVRFEK